MGDPLLAIQIKGSCLDNIQMLLRCWRLLLVKNSVQTQIKCNLNSLFGIPSVFSVFVEGSIDFQPMC